MTGGTVCPRKEVKMWQPTRHFSIIKATSNGEVKFVLRSSLGPPKLDEKEQLVVSKDSREYNPPAPVRKKIFRKLREEARAKNIPFVINLDTR